VLETLLFEVDVVAEGTLLVLTFLRLVFEEFSLDEGCLSFMRIYWFLGTN